MPTGTGHALQDKQLQSQMSKDAALFTAHDEPIALHPKRTVDKQSTEYMVKSGIAGGLAGCAVRDCNSLMYQ